MFTLGTAILVMGRSRKEKGRIWSSYWKVRDWNENNGTRQSSSGSGVCYSSIQAL